jgi:YHYH protein
MFKRPSEVSPIRQIRPMLYALRSVGMVGSMLCLLSACGGGGSDTSATTSTSALPVSGASNTPITTSSTSTAISTTTAPAPTPTPATATATNTSATTTTSATTGSATSGTSSTAGILCGLSGSGSTLIGVATSIVSAFNFNWSCTSTIRTLTSNGIPNHVVGTFPNANNPNTISAQQVTFNAKLSPTQASSASNAGIIGYALNGVKFDPNTGGACSNSASSAATTGPAAQCTYLGAGAWSLEAIVPNSPFNFGADSSNAHVQPTGEYHYHGTPNGLYAALNGTEVNGVGTSMKIVGWAADGYPIYYKYGYTSAMDATSALKKLVGNYKPNSAATSSALRPSATVFPLGTFKNDWAYSASNGGDLDECNGRTGVTPEFPNGTYYYVTTDSYPYVQRCLKGTIN